MEIVLVVVIVGAALAWFGIRIYKTIANKKAGCNCSDAGAACSGCPSAPARVIIQDQRKK